MSFGRRQADGLRPLGLGFLQGNRFGEAQRRACATKPRGDALGYGHTGQGGSRDPFDCDALSKFLGGAPLEIGKEICLENSVHMLLGVSAFQDFQAYDRFIEVEGQQYVGGSGEPDGGVTLGCGLSQSSEEGFLRIEYLECAVFYF